MYPKASKNHSLSDVVDYIQQIIDNLSLQLVSAMMFISRQNKDYAHPFNLTGFWS